MLGSCEHLSGHENKRWRGGGGDNPILTRRKVESGKYNQPSILRKGVSERVRKSVREKGVGKGSNSIIKGLCSTYFCCEVI